MGRGMGTGIAIGMGTGVALGTTMDNIALGIAIGAADGTSLEEAIGQSLQKKEEEYQNLSGNSGTKNTYIQHNKIKLVIGFMILLIGFLTPGIVIFLN